MKQLTNSQKEALLVLRKYPDDIVMDDGWLTGGHGERINLNTVRGLEDRGLIETTGPRRGRISELGKSILLEPVAPTPSSTEPEQESEAPKPEIRIYAISPDNYDYEGELLNLSDEEFITEAEKQGLVWTLPGFIEGLNDEQISDQWFFRHTVTSEDAQRNVFTDKQKEEFYYEEYCQCKREIGEEPLDIEQWREFNEYGNREATGKHTHGKLWRDDDGFIAAGTGDEYVTFADLDCNDRDIDEREANKDRLIEIWNAYPSLVRENEKIKRLLHDLTPGGSEFYNDPERCAKWIRESRLETHLSLSRIIMERKQENASLVADKEELVKLRDQYAAYIEYVDLTINTEDGIIPQSFVGWRERNNLPHL